MRPLPPPLRRAAALGLLALALGLAGLAALAPVVRLAAVRKEIAATAGRIDRQERLLHAAARRPPHAARKLLLTGQTSGMAGAELQRLVSDLARRSGLSVSSTNVAAPRQEADLTAIGVDVSLRGRTEGLRTFLHAIETGVPILFVETLSIQAVPAYRPVREPVSLDVTLRVRGYGAGKDID